MNSSEYTKLLRATSHAVDLETQKRDMMKNSVEEYENNVYRVRFVESIGKERKRFVLIFRRRSRAVYRILTV